MFKLRWEHCEQVAAGKCGEKLDIDTQQIIIVCMGAAYSVVVFIYKIPRVDRNIRASN